MLSESEGFDFTCLLHTYFRVPDITKTTISGLGALQYVDKVRRVHDCVGVSRVEHDFRLMAEL